MRKTFSLEAPNLKPARVIDAIKSTVRKYLKRERGKELPEGADFWDFDCKTGRDEQSAVRLHHTGLNGAIDKASQESWPEIYIEVLARTGHRTSKLAAPSSPEASPEASPELDESSE